MLFTAIRQKLGGILPIREAEEPSITKATVVGPQESVSLPHKKTTPTQKKILSSRADLKAIPGKITQFRADLVGEKMSSRFCPAILEDNTWIILSTPEYISSDAIKTVEAICKKNSKDKNSSPLIFQITPTLLLTLRQGGKSSHASRNSASSGTNQNAYKSAFNEIIAWGVRNNASDVHINVDARESISQIHFSIDGQYVAPPLWRVPTDRLREIINVAWQESKGGAGSVFDSESELQCRVEVVVDNMRIMGRWASMATDRGPSICLRLLKVDQESVSRTLEEQGFLPSQVAMFERSQTSEGGAIVLAGTVGSGKSTTIASILSNLPDTRKIITLEDPVEYRIRNALQNTIVRSLNEEDEMSFLSKLKTVKRSAPHDLLIGEIRDTTTGMAFMDVVGSGTSVYTTVHATSAMQIPERLSSQSIGIPRDFLGSPGILNLMVFQALLPVLCHHCSLPIKTFHATGGLDYHGKVKDPEHWKRYTERLERLYNIDTSKIRVKQENGCEHCRHPEVSKLNGYAGRTVVAEMLEPNTDRTILRHIRSGDTLSLQEHLDRLRMDSAIDDPDMKYKSIMGCALYKSSLGIIDPRDIEIRTHSFETEALIRNQSSRSL